jgi:hypothetical protein
MLVSRSCPNPRSELVMSLDKEQEGRYEPASRHAIPNWDPNVESDVMHEHSDEARALVVQRPVSLHRPEIIWEEIEGTGKFSQSIICSQARLRGRSRGPCMARGSA